MRILVEFDCSDRKRFNVLGHGLSNILFLHDDLVLELAVPSCIESSKTIDVDAEQTLKRIKEKDVFHLHIMFLRQNFVSVTHEIGDDCIAIVTSSCQDLTALLDCNSIAALLVLFHHVSDRTLRVLGCIFIMDEHFCAHRDRYDPS